MSGYLALDVGDRRIGVAVCEWSDLVVPLGVVARGPDEVATIRRHVDERSIETLVVGMPLSLDDSIGSQAKKVLEFVERLREALAISIELHDERFTTHEAEALLIDADVSRARRRRSIDAQAAAEILKDYLSTRDVPRPDF